MLLLGQCLTKVDLKGSNGGLPPDTHSLQGQSHKIKMQGLCILYIHTLFANDISMNQRQMHTTHLMSQPPRSMRAKICTWLACVY